jgi:hypothetical protein
MFDTCQGKLGLNVTAPDLDNDIDSNDGNDVTDTTENPQVAVDPEGTQVNLTYFKAAFTYRCDSNFFEPISRNSFLILMENVMSAFTLVITTLVCQTTWKTRVFTAGKGYKVKSRHALWRGVQKAKFHIRLKQGWAR